jgi:hypothetical protein
MQEKPKLVFLRSPKPGLPPFVEQHLQEHVRCLSVHFEVVLVSGDCDYQAVCETHRPDIALFETGIYSGPRRITRTSGCPQVPKVGFCNADAYCVTRSVFLSDMDRWGIETLFTHSVAMAEYTPEIADRLFVWPNFVDTSVYRDYGQAKGIQVLFTGSQAPHYPWRRRVQSAVAPQYSSLTTPHAGWADAEATRSMVQGVEYAKLLNAAWVVPTCGTIARDLVRKHLEIPAARACLVTERTRSVEAAGFVDMRNAVFAEPDDIGDKLEFLFTHPDELRQIIDAGFDLVQARHTMTQRDQLLQWLRLHESAGPGQRIVQSGPFDALRLVPSSSGATNSHPVSNGLDRQLLGEGQRLLSLGQYDEAGELFLRCLDYHFMPEPLLGLVRSHLYRGNAAQAVALVSRPIDLGLCGHFAVDPDPVEWAYLVRSLLCHGHVRAAARLAKQFPTATHLELERIRQVTSALTGGDGHTSVTHTPKLQGRASVHRLPELDHGAWGLDLCAMLRASHRSRLADAVMASWPGQLVNRARGWRREDRRERAGPRAA